MRSNSIDHSAAFFDVDGTLTSERVWHGMLEYFQHRGLRQGTHLLYVGLHYPTYIFRKLGMISEATFRRPWAANMAWYLRGYTPKDCEPIWDWIVNRYLNSAWRNDILKILREHINAGSPVVLVSSGPRPMIKQIAIELGSSHAVGTELETKNGRYTGRSIKPICIDHYKASMAQKYLKDQGIVVNLKESYAYADSTSDLQMLEMVGNPVAVYPDNGLRKIAIERNWRIIPE